MFLTPYDGTRTHVRRSGAPGPTAPGQTAALPLPLPVPRLLEHARVGAVELELDLGAAAGEARDIAPLLRAGPPDLAVHARELELESLHLEHLRPGGLPSGFDDQLGHQRGQLGIIARQPVGRIGEVRTQVLGR